MIILSGYNLHAVVVTLHSCHKHVQARTLRQFGMCAAQIADARAYGGLIRSSQSERRALM
jgi:hypothetical protein